MQEGGCLRELTKRGLESLRVPKRVYFICRILCLIGVACVMRAQLDPFQHPIPIYSERIVIMD